MKVTILESEPDQPSDHDDFGTKLTTMPLDDRSNVQLTEDRDPNADLPEATNPRPRDDSDRSNIQLTVNENPNVNEPGANNRIILPISNTRGNGEWERAERRIECRATYTGDSERSRRRKTHDKREREEGMKGFRGVDSYFASAKRQRRVER